LGELTQSSDASAFQNFHNMYLKIQQRSQEEVKIVFKCSREEDQKRNRQDCVLIK
jgi:hypothetical protein